MELPRCVSLPSRRYRALNRSCRLKLRFQPRADRDITTGRTVVRLYSLDHTGLCISDYRDSLLEPVLRGIPHSLLLESSNPQRAGGHGELLLLVPSFSVYRPFIASCPFSALLVQDRGDPDWLEAMHSERYFIYPLHISNTFLTTPTQASALYLALLRLFNRQYFEAIRVVQSVEADSRLTPAENWLVELLGRAGNDHHPDAVAVRLKLTRALLHCGRRPAFPWLVQEEYKRYLSKLDLVSAGCRLTVNEERYLLSHLQQGTELDPTEMEQDMADFGGVGSGSGQERVQQQRQETSYQAQFLEVELANRAAVLAAVEDGDPSAFTQNRLPLGERVAWLAVEQGTERLFTDFNKSEPSMEARTWYAKLEYARPTEQKLVLGEAVKALGECLC